MVWPDFVLYQLSYSRCLATLVGRIRTCDSDVIQTDSRLVLGCDEVMVQTFLLSYQQLLGCGQDLNL